MDFRLAYLESVRLEFARYRRLGLQSINRQVSHYAYHVGQIVLLAKQCKGTAWVSLSVPKGKSAEYTQGNYTKP